MKKHVKSIICILVFVILICTTVLSIFFYVNSYKQKDLEDYSFPLDEIDVTNYDEFEISNSLVKKTQYIDSSIIYNDDVYAEFSVNTCQAVEANYISKGDVIGNNESGEVKSTVNGRIVSIIGAASEYEVKVLDYEKIRFRTEIYDGVMNDFILNKVYKAELIDQLYDLSLKSINYSFDQSKITLEFGLCINETLEDLYLLSNSKAHVIVTSEAWTGFNISKNVLGKIKMSEGDTYSLICKDKQDRYVNIYAFCQIIGDSQVGLIINYADVENLKSVCVLAG